MWLEIIVLVLAIPVGFLIAWLARDELLQGKPYFRILMIISILTGIWFWLTGFMVITWIAGFIFIVSLISLVKSEDKRWTKKR